MGEPEGRSMMVEQRGYSVDVDADSERDIIGIVCGRLVEDCYLPRQRGGTPASRLALAQAAFIADLPCLLGTGSAAEVEGAGE